MKKETILRKKRQKALQREQPPSEEEKEVSLLLQEKSKKKRKAQERRRNRRKKRPPETEEVEESAEELDSPEETISEELPAIPSEENATPKNQTRVPGSAAAKMANNGFTRYEDYLQKQVRIGLQKAAAGINGINCNPAMQAKLKEFRESAKLRGQANAPPDA